MGRQLADFFGSHDFQTRVGVALDLERLLETGPDARDDHLFDALSRGAGRLRGHPRTLTEQCEGNGATDQRRTSGVHEMPFPL